MHGKEILQGETKYPQGPGKRSENPLMKKRATRSSKRKRRLELEIGGEAADQPDQLSRRRLEEKQRREL